MDLLEYQVKEWFGKVGIPILPSQRIDHPADLKRLKIHYPIVLKSQVHAAEREKAGGVRIVETTIDAIAAAQTIFNLSIWGELPEVILAESKYDPHQEFYVGVVLDTSVCRPVLIGCEEANVENWKILGEKMQYIIVEQEFSPFYARQLALKMGLRGILMQSVSDVIEKMYHLFLQQDLDLIEINPLAVNVNGQVMALNGKIRINQRAINRHPEMSQIVAKIAARDHSRERNGFVSPANAVQKHGKIGIIGNGTGSILTTLDLVVSAGGKPGLCLNLRHTFVTDTTPTTFADRLTIGLKMLADDKSIQVILINFVGTIPQLTQMPEIITKFAQQDISVVKSHTSRTNSIKSRQDGYLPRLIVRLAGSNFDHARKCLMGLKTQHDSLIVVENLDTVVEAIRLTKPTNHKKLPNL